MKKSLTLVLLLVIAFMATDMIIADEAKATPCDMAGEYNWSNPGWNTICMWYVQMMDPPSDGGGHVWVMNTKDGATVESAQQPLHLINPKMQTIPKKQFVAWQAIRV